MESATKKRGKLVFAKKKKTPGEENEPKEKWLVLIVDDDPDVHQVTKLALSDFSYDNRRVSFLSAYSGKEAAELMKENQNVALILLDVVMETEDAGLKLVHHIRNELKNHLVRIILRTGQPGQAPERQVIVEYDINDYKSKPELTDDKLFTSVITSIRTYKSLIEREVAVQELRKTEGYLKNIIDSMPSILIGIDQKAKVTQWNRRAEEETGLTPNDAVQKDLAEVFPLLKDHMDTVFDWIQERESKSERIKVNSNKASRHIDLMAYPLTTGAERGAVLRLDDITSRVRLEEMIVQTEKMMSVGGLAAGMAHEINNPLSGILQSAQNTLRRISPELNKNVEVAQECGVDLAKLREYMEKRGILLFLSSIKDAGERASRIVANMLQFSRRSESKRAPADLSRLFERILELASSDYDLKRDYDFRKIKILKEFDANIPEVPCVVMELEQVILNLLKNAAQALCEQKDREEPPQIILRTKLMEDNMVRIEVEDNGPGIKEEVRKRIFEPFFTTKEVGVGTGLGLSVSYFIITNNHRGSMSVESTPGQGTKFIINLSLEWELD